MSSEQTSIVNKTQSPKGKSERARKRTPEKDLDAPKPKEKSKAKQFDAYSIPCSSTSQAGKLENAGYSTHVSESGTGQNSHEPAALNRAQRRSKGLRLATSLCQKGARLHKKKGCVVVGYPSGYEAGLSKRLKHMFPFRDELYPGDEVRLLPLHTPRLPKDAFVVVVLNDCPSADLLNLFSQFSAYNGGHLHVVVTGISYGGRLGVDKEGSKVATVWHGADFVDTIHPDCVTQYRDPSQTEWLDMYSGSLGPLPGDPMDDAVYFVQKPEQQVGTAGFVTVLLLSRDTRESVPLAKPLSSLGVVVDKRGLVPGLISYQWQRVGTSSAAEQSYDRAINAKFRQIYFDIETTPMPVKWRLELEQAIINTGNHCQKMEGLALELPVERRSLAAMKDATRRRLASNVGGLAGMMTILQTRAPLVEMIAALMGELRKACTALYLFLRGCWTRLRKTSPALNVLWSGYLAAQKCANSLSDGGGTAARRLLSYAEWLRNRVGGSFPGAGEFEPSEVYGLLTRLVLVLFTVGAERYVSVRGGALGTALMAVVEACLKIFMEESAGARVLVGAQTVIGHLVLSLLPIWISAPGHALWDLDHLEVLADFTNYLDRRGWTASAVFSPIRARARQVIDRLQARWRDGEVHIDQLEALEDDFGNLSYQSWVLGGDLPPGVTLDGYPLNSRAIQNLMGDKTARRAAVCLLDIEPLRNVALTVSHPITLISALMMRYNGIEKAPKTARKEIRPASTLIIRALKPYILDYAPLTEEEFERHMTDSNFPKRKKEAYRLAMRTYKTQPPETATTAPISGKSNELLKVREGKQVKTRIVHVFEPSAHWPDITYALGAKKLLATFVREYTFQAGTNDRQDNCFVYKCLFYRPEKGTTTEMAEPLARLQAKEVLINYSGDDSKLSIKKVLDICELAVDLKSCDTTIQDGLLAEVHSVLRTIGVPKFVTDRVMQYNRAPKQARVRQGESLRTIRLALAHAMNASGTVLTTLTTDLVMLMFWTKVFKQWDGNLNRLVSLVGETARVLGLKLTIERPPLVGPSGLAPLGQCTFLSHLAFEKDTGELIYVPASFTKSLLFKGRNQQDRGKSRDFAVATRCQESRLSATPLSRAYQRALYRHLLDHPVPWVGAPAPNVYKAEFDHKVGLTEDEEFRLLSRLDESITHSVYQAEIDAWNDVHKFPVAATPGSFPIAEFLARFHYGYLLNDEVRGHDRYYHWSAEGVGDELHGVT